MEKGWFVLRGAGREQTASVPYWPLVEALQAAMVERPEIAESLTDPERTLLARLTGLTGDHQLGAVHRHAVLHLVFRVLAGAGASRAMLFVDDLHHVDDDTLALAEILASASVPRGVLLLGAYRADVDERAVRTSASMVARGVGVEISLAPLNRSESDAMVVDVLNRPASDVELDLAWELSEGNPFFALELAAALSSDRPAAATGGYRAVDVRLERLPADARTALRSVAIVAAPVHGGRVRRPGRPRRRPGPRPLETAISLGVLARQGGSYRFRHDLVRERLTETVTDDERAAAHGGGADRLAALGAPPARLAHHLLAAGREQRCPAVAAPGRPGGDGGRRPRRRPGRHRPGAGHRAPGPRAAGPARRRHERHR